MFESKLLPTHRDSVAADGTDVRLLLGLKGGNMAHFHLAPGQTSSAIKHKSVDEIWFFISGQGEIWRKHDTQEEFTGIIAGLCITIPSGIHFQLRSIGSESLEAIAVSMPRWPGDEEVAYVDGPWNRTTHDEP